MLLNPPPALETTAVNEVPASVRFMIERAVSFQPRGVGSPVVEIGSLKMSIAGLL